MQPNRIEGDPNSKNTGLERSESRTSISRKIRWAETSFALVLIAYTALAILASRYAYFEWDLGLTRKIQSLHGFGFETLMAWVSVPGSGWAPVVLVAGTGLGLLRVRLKLEALILMSGAAIETLLNRLLKEFINRPRPSGALVHVGASYHFESFPSGHVMFFVEFFGFLLFLCYVLMKRGAIRTVSMILLAAPILIVGLSRVWLGAHWPSDVAGAYLAGGLLLFIIIEVYRRLKSGGNNRSSGETR